MVNKRTREALVKEARDLRSEHGENKEYDRALCELIYWTAGGESVEAVAKEVLHG
jgi:hypothetical protein